jgi:hypothetical protein
MANKSIYKEGDTLLFEKENDTASGETCVIKEILNNNYYLEWCDGQITIEPLCVLIKYFTIKN